MKRSHSSQIGASLIEYALLISLIAVVCVTSINTIGTNVRCTFYKVSYFGIDPRENLPSEEEEEEVNRKECINS